MTAMGLVVGALLAACRASRSANLPSVRDTVQCGASATADVLRLDSSCLTPDAAHDPARGGVHVVYGTANKDAFYTFASTNSSVPASSRPSVQLNPSGFKVTTTMGERGPKIALAASGGRIVVVWADLWTGPGCRVYARSVWSDDGGATWSRPALIAPTLFGIDGLGVAALGQAAGSRPSTAVATPPLVVASFHVNTSDPTNASSATWLHTAVSADGGATWGPPAVAWVDGGRTPAVACSMCMTRPRFDPATGDLLVAYRAAIDNVRDFRVIRAANPGANAFTTTVVNPLDHWVIRQCPMNGPELSLATTSVASAGDEHVAFMTDDANHVYFSSRAAGNHGFSGHVATPAHEPNERYPTAVAAATGDVLFVWNVGPMAVSGTSLVKWACYAPGNSTAAQSGALGRSFAGTKATAVAVAADRLLLLTSAA